jgi:hypothetical protein
LFYIEDTGKWGTENPNLYVPESMEDGTLNWPEESIVWNIIWTDWWISGKWEFVWWTPANLKTLNETPDHVSGSEYNQGFVLVETTVEEFLIEWRDTGDHYLTLYNVGDRLMEYELSTWDNESFTKPVTTVYSSAKIGDMKQNIELEIDNSKYFDVLKYSIYDY